jgi:short-subunit dehydrogenase
MKTYNFTNKTVLLTGASAGIGACLARELSQQGAKLILVARSAERLKALAATLTGAEIIAEDLTSPGASQRIYDEVTARGLSVDVLINNAGFGLHGDFQGISLKDQQEQIGLNITSLVELTYLFMPMIESRQGGVIQVASMAGFIPVPYMAVYGATKAFVLSFGAALWAEYKSKGVRVLTLVPGATQTEFFARAGEGAAAGAKKARPEDVARDGIKAFIKGRATVVSGTQNRIAAFLSRWFSRESNARVLARMNRPRTKPA